MMAKRVGLKVRVGAVDFGPEVLKLRGSLDDVAVSGYTPEQIAARSRLRCVEAFDGFRLVVVSLLDPVLLPGEADLLRAIVERIRLTLE